MTGAGAALLWGVIFYTAMIFAVTQTVRIWFADAARTDRVLLAEMRQSVNRVGLSERQFFVIAGFLWPILVIAMIRVLTARWSR